MNDLAKSLFDALAHPQGQFTLTDHAFVFNSKQCLNRVRDYQRWLKALDVHSVMIVSHPSIDALCLCYALILSNKTYIPVHPSTSAELISTYLQQYQVDLLLVQSELKLWADNDLTSKLSQDIELGFYYYQPPVARSFCLLPGAILFTSGTTGLPKAVYYEFDTLARYVLWCAHEFQLTSEDVMLFTSELSFAASLRPLFVPLLSGAKLHFIAGDSANKLQLIVKLLLERVITVLNLTPTFFKTLLRHFQQSSQLPHLSSIRLILLSGEPIEIEDINFWYQQVNNHTVFYNLYGTTECLIPFYKRITAPVSEDERLHLGQIRPDCNYYLMPQADKGYELYVSGNSATAFLDTDTKHNHYIEVDNQRYIKTSDFVTQGDKGLYFCSREQRLIKRYGQLINLNQIEQVLKKLPGTLGFTAFADEKNTIHLIITGADQNDELLTRVKQHLKQHLPDYMHPSVYLFSDQLPLTSSGKIDYFSIKNQFGSQSGDLFTQYFSRFFADGQVYMDAKIKDLGLESVDYLEMAEVFYQATGKWLDVSKINDHLPISSIVLCFVEQGVEAIPVANSVRINPLQRSYYSYELDSKSPVAGAYQISSWRLPEDIDLKKLQQAIAETMAGHFLLNSRLKWVDHDYFFVEAQPQTTFYLQQPLFFRKRALDSLKTFVHDQRLVRIYILKDKKQVSLVMAYHHIALDGWSVLLVREEIFSRYQGKNMLPSLTKKQEVAYLNQANQVKLNANYNLQKIKQLLAKVNAYEFNHLGAIFSGQLERKNTMISLKTHALERYAAQAGIGGSPHSVLFALLFYQMVYRLSGAEQLFFYVSLSNRNLPIPQVKYLFTNLAIGLPLFMNGSHLSFKELAQRTEDDLTVYFKNMNYAALDELYQKELIHMDFLDEKNQPYVLIYSYINQIVDHDYIQNQYIDWAHSVNKVYPQKRKVIFLRVYNMGAHFVVTLDSYMAKGMHDQLISILQDQCDV